MTEEEVAAYLEARMAESGNDHNMIAHALGVVAPALLQNSGDEGFTSRIHAVRRGG